QVTSTPEVNRTRATLRNAEFGLRGVTVKTRVQTRRGCGDPFSAGALFFFFWVSRPSRTSCWMVGIGLLSALFRCQDPAHATNTPGSGSRSCARKTAGATGKAIDLARRASTNARRVACVPASLPEGSLQCSGYGAGMDLGRMRGLAREAALVGAGAIMGAARPGQAAAKGLP